MHKERTLGELKGLLEKLPHFGDEDAYFGKNLKAIIKHQPAMPKNKNHEKIKGLKVEKF